jgi:acylphosphatase
MEYAVRGIVSGRVQGVGFRNHVKKAVATTQVRGHALNLSDHSVEIVLIGDREEVLEVQKAVAEGPRYSRVENLAWEALEDIDLEGFRIG